MPNQDTIHQYEPLMGSWYVEEEIGEGSFGIVYKVQKDELGEHMVSAVKLISIPDKAQYKDAETRLGDDVSTLKKYFLPAVQNIMKEVKVLSSLVGNSNVLAYHDCQVNERKDGVGWDVLIRMEYIKPLKKYLKEHKMTEMDVIQLGIDICRALESCSKKELIHRDIKDDNIFINDEGVFKLGDFGIAKELSKITTHGTKIGTISYMAPEVYSGKMYNELVDIYSLGIVMYRLLNNLRLPFLPPYPQEYTVHDDNIAQDRRLGGEVIPAPANANVDLAKIVLKACAYRPEDRFQSAGEMRNSLKEVLRGLKAAIVKDTGMENEKTHHISKDDVSIDSNDLEQERGTESVWNRLDKPDGNGSLTDEEYPMRGTVNIFDNPNIDNILRNGIKPENRKNGNDPADFVLGYGNNISGAENGKGSSNTYGNINENGVGKENNHNRVYNNEHSTIKENLNSGNSTLNARRDISESSSTKPPTNVRPNNYEKMRVKVWSIGIIGAIVLLLIWIAYKIAVPSFYPNTSSRIKVGDYLNFGQYYGESILWKCVEKNNEEMMLVSEYILCQKAFDSAESGNWDQGSDEIQKYGSNVWANSNIREWLNSTDQIVEYTTQAPTKNAVWDGKNAYADEPGFLSNFTQSERDSIKTVTHEGTTDKVFLPSGAEINPYYGDLDTRRKRKITAIGRQNGEHKYDNEDNYWHYWMRTSEESHTYMVRYVHYDGTFIGLYRAGYGGVGVAPALHISSYIPIKGTGTIDDPWSY